MSNYFNIKYVSEGPYFNVKGGTPPAPTLPTVTYLSTVYGLLSTASIASGGTSSPFKAKAGGAYEGDYFTKNNSKQYAFFRYNDGVAYKNAGGVFEVAWSQDNYLCAKNVTDSAEDLESVRIAECSSADAQVVTVYDIEYGYASYAFKFNLSGTYYYSVLDGMFGPSEWTDDLAAEGYTEDPPAPPVVLPEVVLLGNAEYDYWLYVGATTANITLSSGNNCPLYSDRGSSSYGWTTYPKAVISCQKYEYSEYWNVAKGRTGLSLVMSTLSGVQWPGCQNDLNESITFIRLKAAYCKNDSATVVTVYNSSNVTYNAFKFTAGSTDYYYVLDCVQTDWADDLSSIGYHLYEPSTLTAYSSSGEGNSTRNGTINASSYGALLFVMHGLDSSEDIPYDSSKTYTITRIFKADGTSVDNPQNVVVTNKKYNGDIVDYCTVWTQTSCALTGKWCGIEYTVS